MNLLRPNYNPDILTCLANLSSDEVFTPPKLANQILDLLPAELWKNKNVKFLDPFTKTAVFLREIAKRLMTGLEKEIPNKQKRINYIFKNQLYGIAITELTALLSRRSVYCSKAANGKYSVCDVFDDKQGNIVYTKTKHSWNHGRCIWCGASQEVYDRGNSLESHAYQFIHTQKTNKIFNNMKFDVIVGNPPYQLNDGGGMGSSAIPIYHKFIQQAKKLNPRFLTMIIPSRWFTGGRGLDEFRDEMLNDLRIRELHDFINSRDCFPSLGDYKIKGGVCYFLWDREYKGKCEVYSYEGDKTISKSLRTLLEKGTDTFIRSNEALLILQKIRKSNEESFANLVSANDPFGFDVRVEGSYKRVLPTFKKVYFKNSVLFYYYGWQKNGLGYIQKKNIKKNIESIKGYKIFIPKAWGVGNLSKDWLTPFIVEPNSCCTETYLMIGPFANKRVAENILSYTQTKFFHFLVSLIKITQNAMKKVYSFVPMQSFNEEWTDEKLYKKYKLSEAEIDFIESMVKPME